MAIWLVISLIVIKKRYTNEITYIIILKKRKPTPLAVSHPQQGIWFHTWLRALTTIPPRRIPRRTCNSRIITSGDRFHDWFCLFQAGHIYNILWICWGLVGSSYLGLLSSQFYSTTSSHSLVCTLTPLQALTSIRAKSRLFYGLWLRLCIWLSKASIWNLYFW